MIVSHKHCFFASNQDTATAGRSREMDLLSDHKNLDIMLGERKLTPIERGELGVVISRHSGQRDTESLSNLRENSSQGIEIRDIIAKV